MLKCCTAAVARYPTKLLAASRKKRCLLVRKFCFFTRFCGRLFSPLWGGNLKSTRHVVRAATRRAQGHWQIVFSEGSETISCGLRATTCCAAACTQQAKI